MQIKFRYIMLLCLLSALSIFSFRHSIVTFLDNYGIKKAEEAFGTRSLKAEYENQIREIATKMNIAEPFLVRRMNSAAMRIFGYCNAFVYFYQFLNIIPLTNTPILFVSETFFEDLSPEEQRFLISHELIHIQEHHFQYLAVVVFSLLLLLAFIAYRVRKFFVFHMSSYLKFKYARQLSMMLFALVVYSFGMIPILGSYAYRRHMEMVADHKGLTALKEFDGAIKFIQRLNQDWGNSLDNEGYGLLADHPSGNERINYCLTLKKNHEEQL